MEADLRAQVLKFLKTQKLAVIATSGDGQSTPESALIAFVEDDELCLYFQTGRQTRKAANLKLNPQASFVIGLGLGELLTIQYEGAAEQITKPEELAACKRQFVAKDSPTTEEYFNNPAAIFFKVTPKWIGCSEYAGKSPKVTELWF